jgi:hypothetical protein
MPRYEPRGRIAVVWCPTIVLLTAPSVAEITAGVKLAKYMTPDGLSLPLSGSLIDTADAGSEFNTTEVGPYGGDPGSYNGFRDADPSLDVPWNTLVRLASGFFVVAPTGWNQSAGTSYLGSASNTPTAGDRCQVWPARISIAAPVDGKDKTADMVKVTFAIPQPPQLNAVVA